MKTIADVLDVELVDNSDPYGGISFLGETVKDFIEDTSLEISDPIELLNIELRRCVIKEIQTF